MTLLKFTWGFTLTPNDTFAYIAVYHMNPHNTAHLKKIIAHSSQVHVWGLPVWQSLKSSQNGFTVFTVVMSVNPNK